MPQTGNGKMLARMEEVRAQVAERDELIEVIAIALLTRKNVFILGDTGQAKSYVVNLRYVRTWEMDSFTLADGSVVNISRPYWQTARSVYACYLTQSQDAPALEKSQPPPSSARGIQR